MSLLSYGLEAYQAKRSLPWVRCRVVKILPPPYILTGPLPISSSGTTAGYLDDYDEACPYTGSTAPDVVYAFTPVSGVTVDIDLCGSSFDTKVFVYENTVTSGDPFDCNDDFYYESSCGFYVSRIEAAVLTGGYTYYIVIDGYTGEDYGDYILTISESAASCTWGVDVICPPGAVAESEVCGDDDNGGCDMASGTETWVVIPSSGGIICGTTWADAGNRDTDWFELVLTESSFVAITADADQLIEYGLMEGGTGGYNGNPDCSTLTGIEPGNTAGPCNETFLDIGILGPGTYWFIVRMTVNNGYPCENHYWIEFEVAPQTCITPDELITSNITTTTAELGWTEAGAAIQWEYQYGPAGFTPGVSGTATVLNPVSIAGLTPNSTYEFFVRADCGSEFSQWDGPSSFTTLCEAISSLPWTEGFESAWPPECWSDAEISQFGWDQSTYGTAHSGNEWAYCNLEGSVLKSPSFTLSSNSYVVFWFRVENADFPQDLTVKAGNDVIYQIVGATNETYWQAGVSLADYTGQTVSLSFTCASGTGALYPGICLDDVSVKTFNTWTGMVSVAWNNTGNWSKGTVPSASDAALIPSSPSGNKFPVVSGGIAAECDFISISPGATVMVQSGGTFDVKNP